MLLQLYYIYSLFHNASVWVDFCGLLCHESDGVMAVTVLTTVTKENNISSANAAGLPKVRICCAGRQWMLFMILIWVLTVMKQKVPERSTGRQVLNCNCVCYECFEQYQTFWFFLENIVVCILRCLGVVGNGGTCMLPLINSRRKFIGVRSGDLGGRAITPCPVHRAKRWIQVLTQLIMQVWWSYDLLVDLQMWRSPNL